MIGCRRADGPDHESGWAANYLSLAILRITV